MLKSFDEMENGTIFVNSFTHTTCVKISLTKYFDFTLKHCITMRKDLTQYKHLLAKIIATTALGGRK